MATKSVPKVPPAERVQSSYKLLSAAANDLNAASDELGKAISALDASLKRLNLGVPAWVMLSGDDDGPNSGHWWSRDLGYAKVGDKWGIALRKRSGNYNYPDEESEDIWLFNEGPRWMRTEAVGKIPELMEELVRQAQDTTKKIKDKTALALDLGAAINGVAEKAQSEQESISSLVKSMLQMAEDGQTPEAI